MRQFGVVGCRLSSSGHRGGPSDFGATRAAGDCDEPVARLRTSRHTASGGWGPLTRSPVEVARMASFSKHRRPLVVLAGLVVMGGTVLGAGGVAAGAATRSATAPF